MNEKGLTGWAGVGKLTDEQIREENLKQKYIIAADEKDYFSAMKPVMGRIIREKGWTKNDFSILFKSKATFSLITLDILMSDVNWDLLMGPNSEEKYWLFLYRTSYVKYHTVSNGRNGAFIKDKFYNSTIWKNRKEAKTKKIIDLKHDLFCERCNKKAEAYEVHHSEENSFFSHSIYDLSDLRFYCVPCHDIVTNEERKNNTSNKTQNKSDMTKDIFFDEISEGESDMEIKENTLIEHDIKTESQKKYRMGLAAKTLIKQDEQYGEKFSDLQRKYLSEKNNALKTREYSEPLYAAIVNFFTEACEKFYNIKPSKIREQFVKCWTNILSDKKFMKEIEIYNQSTDIITNNMNIDKISVKENNDTHKSNISNETMMLIHKKVENNIDFINEIREKVCSEYINWRIVNKK